MESFVTLKNFKDKIMRIASSFCNIKLKLKFTDYVKVKKQNLQFIDEEIKEEISAQFTDKRNYLKYLRISESDESFYYISKKLKKPIYLLPTTDSSKTIFVFNDEKTIFKYYKGKQSLSKFIDDIIGVIYKFLKIQEINPVIYKNHEDIWLPLQKICKKNFEISDIIYTFSNSINVPVKSVFFLIYFVQMVMSVEMNLFAWDQTNDKDVDFRMDLRPSSESIFIKKPFIIGVLDKEIDDLFGIPLLSMIIE